jgi:hypothetical protein
MFFIRCSLVSFFYFEILEKKNIFLYFYWKKTYVFFNTAKIFSSLLIIYSLFYYGLNIIKFLFLKILKIGFWFFISSKTKNKNKKFYAATKMESNITESLTRGAFSLATYLLSFTATSALKITVAGAWKDFNILPKI